MTMRGALAAAVAVATAVAHLAGAPARPVLRVGLFLPAQGEDGAEARAIARGARLAADEVNAAPGAILIELAERQADGQWTAGAREFVALAYDQDAAVVIGGPGGRRAHLAEQIVTRAAGRLLFLSLASDPTVTEVKVPWVFRMVPDDRVQARELGVALQRSPGGGRVALLTEKGDYDAESLAAQLSAVVGSMAVRVPFTDTAAARHIAVAQVKQTHAAVAVLAGRPGPSGRLAAVLHASVRGVRMLGPSRLAATEFVAAAGSASEQAEVLSPSVGSEAVARGARERFAREYLRAHGEAPPPMAAVAFDAVGVLAATARHAGIGPRALADGLRRGSHEGLSGPVRFDAAGNRLGQPHWLVVRAGRFVPQP